MGLSKYNSHGYYDPTPYQASVNMDRELHKWRPLVYICSPYAGEVEENTENARRYSRFAVDSGAIPLTPHLLFPQFLSDNTERELAMVMNKTLMGKCREVWVFGDKRTPGMVSEIARAKRRRMKIRYFTEECKEVRP